MLSGGQIFVYGVSRYKYLALIFTECAKTNVLPIRIPGWSVKGGAPIPFYLEWKNIEKK